MSAALKKIVIVGAGLIGGSFALALRRAHAVEQIVGIGRSAASLQRALQLGLIDAASTALPEALQDADLVLVSVPVAQTEAVLRAAQPHLSAHTVVTDAGSIKADVVAAARRALGDRVGQFVPGHPIAGREVSGPDAAIADLYVGRKVVLTPIPENDIAVVERVAAAWRLTGAEIHHMKPEQHDAVFAAVSHLPHLLSFAMVNEMVCRPEADLLLQYAAGGFRDFTRLASSSPEMWRDISLANQQAILVELDAYIAQLGRFRGQLAARDGDAMQAMFSQAQRARDAWLQRADANAAQQKTDEDA